MNIIKLRQEKRAMQIGQLVRTVEYAFGQGIDIEYERLIKEACFTLQLSRRTAMEYLDIALIQVPHEIIKRDKVKLIVNKDSKDAKADTQQYLSM